MSTTELELEIAQAVESNPLLDWSDSSDEGAGVDNDGSSDDAGGDNDAPPDNAESSGDDWAPAELDWSSGGSGGSFDDDDDNGSAAERVAETEPWPTTCCGSCT